MSSEIAVNPELRAAWHRGLGEMLTGCVRQIVTRADARRELAPDADIDLLPQLPLPLLQNWRLEHAGRPGGRSLTGSSASSTLPAGHHGDQTGRLTHDRGP